jgi:hypothetical protein
MTDLMKSINNLVKTNNNDYSLTIDETGNTIVLTKK